MVIYVKFLLFPYFLLFFWFDNMILTEQVMTLQIRSRIEYLIHTYNILVLIC